MLLVQLGLFRPRVAPSYGSQSATPRLSVGHLRKHFAVKYGLLKNGLYLKIETVFCLYLIIAIDLSNCQNRNNIIVCMNGGKLRTHTENCPFPRGTEPFSKIEKAPLHLQSGDSIQFHTSFSYRYICCIQCNLLFATFRQQCRDLFLARAQI